MTTNNTRIAAIQAYANKHGYVLALPKVYHFCTVGFNDCTPESQSYQLDKAANYLREITHSR